MLGTRSGYPYLQRLEIGVAGACTQHMWSEELDIANNKPL